MQFALIGYPTPPDAAAGGKGEPNPEQPSSQPDLQAPRAWAAVRAGDSAPEGSWYGAAVLLSSSFSSSSLLSPSWLLSSSRSLPRRGRNPARRAASPT